jgi:hypothetical protein
MWYASFPSHCPVVHFHIYHVIFPSLIGRSAGTEISMQGEAPDGERLSDHTAQAILRFSYPAGPGVAALHLSGTRMTSILPGGCLRLGEGAVAAGFATRNVVSTGKMGGPGRGMPLVRWEDLGEGGRGVMEGEKVYKGVRR